jgi:hypothetical protein
MDVELELELEVRLEDVELEDEFTPRGANEQSSISSISISASPSSSRPLVQVSEISGLINA